MVRKSGCRLCDFRVRLWIVPTNRLLAPDDIVGIVGDTTGDEIQQFENPQFEAAMETDRASQDGSPTADWIQMERGKGNLRILLRQTVNQQLVVLARRKSIH